MVTVNSLIYMKMPDGSVTDYNRIFDVTDRVLGTKKNKYKDTERALYQYRDAMRNLDAVRNRYTDIVAPLHVDEAPYLRNPALRVLASEENRIERSALTKILQTAERESEEAKRNVAGMIHLLSDDRQKLIMVAHYICFAEWKHISAVMGFQNRWAKDVHVRAMKTLKERLCEGELTEQSAQMELSIGSLIRQWKKEESEWDMRNREKQRNEKQDDLRLLLGL